MCDVAACVFVARAASACIGRGPFPVIRELHVRCACVCMFAVQSVESCAYPVLFACGGVTSVEHRACPRLWRVGRGSVFVFASCVSDLVFVRGWCIRWMFVVASAKCSACQSVFFLFKFATIVRSPLSLRAVPRAATLSG